MRASGLSLLTGYRSGQGSLDSVFVAEGKRDPKRSPRPVGEAQRPQPPATTGARSPARLASLHTVYPSPFGLPRLERLLPFRHCRGPREPPVRPGSQTSRRRKDSHRRRGRGERVPTSGRPAMAARRGERAGTHPCAGGPLSARVGDSPRTVRRGTRGPALLGERASVRAGATDSGAAGDRVGSEWARRDPRPLARRPKRVPLAQRPARLHGMERGALARGRGRRRGDPRRTAPAPGRRT